jgi:CRISPR-associated endonuclease/helicase Cas3
MPRYAHTAKGKPKSEWHRLDEHLTEVAKMAQGFAESFGAGDWGACAGGLHDAGKGAQAFQNYLDRCAQGIGRRGSVPHAAHKARLAADKHKSFGKLLAYAISGHHGGLPDWGDLERRLGEVENLGCSFN